MSSYLPTHSPMTPMIPPTRFRLFNQVPSAELPPVLQRLLPLPRRDPPHLGGPHQPGQLDAGVAVINESSRPMGQQQPSPPPLTRTDAHWMEAVKSVVGAQYGSGNGAVCGVVASLRSKQNKVALWLRSASDLQQRALIGRCSSTSSMGCLVPTPSDRTRVEFESHDQCLIHSNR